MAQVRIDTVRSGDSKTVRGEIDGTIDRKLIRSLVVDMDYSGLRCIGNLERFDIDLLLIQSAHSLETADRLISLRSFIS